MGKFVLVILLIALAIYLLVRLVERRGLRRRLGGLPPRQARPSGPLGPDDDPDFIWRLNRRKRHPDNPDSP